MFHAGRNAKKKATDSGNKIEKKCIEKNNKQRIGTKTVTDFTSFVSFQECYQPYVVPLFLRHPNASQEV